MVRVILNVVLVVVMVAGGALANDNHFNARVVQHGGADSGNYFVKIQGNPDEYWFDTSTPGGKAMLASLLTCVAMGKNINMVTDGYTVLQLMQAEK